MSFRLWFDVGDGDNNYDGDDDDTDHDDTDDYNTGNYDTDNHDGDNDDTDQAWEQDFLSKRQFTEEQQHQIRDIRRRGKNKVIQWDMRLIKKRVKKTWKNGKTK